MSSLRPASATAFVTSGYCARPSAPESAAAATPSHILLADRDLSAQAPIAEYIARTYPSITIVKASDGDEASKALQDHPVGIARDKASAGEGSASATQSVRTTQDRRNRDRKARIVTSGTTTGSRPPP